MIRHLTALLLLCRLALPVPAETYRWGLSDALDRAHMSNLTLAQRQLDAAAKREAWEASWNLYVPNLDATVGLRRTRPTEASNPEPWSLSGDVVASLRLDSTLGDQVSRARQSWEASVVSYDQARLQLTRDVEKTFYQVLLAEQRVRVAEQNAQLAAAQYDRTLKLYDAGQASDLDLLAARVARENSIPEVLSLRNTLASQRTQLKRLTGLAVGDEVALLGEIVVPRVELDAVSLVQKAQTSSADVRRLRTDLDGLEIGRRISARTSRLPSLSLGYTWATRLNPIAEDFASSESFRDKGTLTLSLTAPLDPLVPHSRDDQAIRTLDAGIAQKRLEIEAALYSSRLEITSLLNQLAGLAQTIKARELAERQAQEVYAQTVIAYDKGARELLDVQDAQARLLAAQVATLNEKFNYISTLADLEFAAGATLLKE